MTPTNLIEQLLRDEGEVLHVYMDPKGIRTAGVGHNLEAHGIDWPVGTKVSQAQSRAWLLQDVELTKKALSEHLPWSDRCDQFRQGVLLNMCFNMGIGKLLLFKHMLAFCEAGNYPAAADAMKQSLWDAEVGQRAHRLEQQMRLGVWV